MMSVDETRSTFARVLSDIAWDQWSQMGISGAPPRRVQRRSADPEALILFSLEAGRDEPRLLDEVLDWMATNHQSLSLHRLRGLAASVEDRMLTDAAIDWVAHWGVRGRTPEAKVPVAGEVVNLFRGIDATRGGMDRVFMAHGFARPPLQPSHKSQPADLSRPINFALRLRRLFGVGAKAEVIRALLTIDAPRLEAQVVARSAGFSQRNVREALNQLADAGVLDLVGVGEVRRYSMAKSSWASALGFGDERSLPWHFDWIQALRALTAIGRWLNDPLLETRSEYMLGSSARTLFDEIAPDLRYAGIRTVGGLPPGPVTWGEINDLFIGSARQVADLTA